ncbi:hypothetical protein JOL79_18820 [Microbispora sp. RL4-1S]|uniref:Fatty acid desaturase domain-containing protein n=1 Tax=Microbispora oryzae TaxID=2806554 RepID=A0A941AKA0_9ACTN|nr:hypothetical protein [Microbispora oryzae]MBP2705867.1 hypothetical protein [Microbispora oryzae]
MSISPPMSVDVRSRAGVLRAEYAERLPSVLQPLLTWITGKAAAGERPPRTVLPGALNTAASMAQWPLSVAATVALLMWNPVAGTLLLPLTWLLGVNALRRLQVVIGHHAVHQEISESSRVNYWIQVVASGESFVHNWEDYFEDHVRGHHSRKVFTTATDPDAELLLHLGFTPGMEERRLWRVLARTIIGPRFHFIFLKARVRTNFVTAPWHRRFVGAAWLGALALVGVLVPWQVFVLAVLVPMFPLYHVSALLQFVSEHAWLAGDRGPVRSSEEYAQRCWGRFSIEPLPARTLPPVARALGWTRWVLKTLLVQVPIRFGVLAGDLPVHDYHHLYPADHDWTKAFWSRQNIIDHNDARGMGEREFCNLAEAIGEVFRGLQYGERHVRMAAPSRR